MEDLARQRILVLGLGISGRSAANFCARHGATVVAADQRPAEAIAELETLDAGIEVRCEDTFPDPADFDLVVPSPGVPAERYRGRARRVMGDVELASRFLAVPVIAITGTNGKSTTTVLAEAMLRAAGFRARAAGNLGAPALDLVGAAIDVAVLEVSSFQLETTISFRPKVAVVLNITPDHLDRHGDLTGYVAAKARIVARQQASDHAVLNFDDPLVRGLATETKARIRPFGTSRALPSGAWLDAGAIVVSRESGPDTRIPLDGMRLAGRHNVENAMAALLAVTAVGADPGRAAIALNEFNGLPHRCEIVATWGRVTFINDSKATNVGAAVRALGAFDGPVIWIGGGRDKGLDFSDLADVAGERMRAAVLIGETAAKIAACLAPHTAVHRAETIEDAVAVAARLARPDDTVLLAPACASQDQFRDYAERGERFRAAVAQLEAGGAPR